MLSDDRITNADLREGKYREAKLIWRLVDWRFPFAGVIREDHYLEKPLTFWPIERIGVVSYGKERPAVITPETSS